MRVTDAVIPVAGLGTRLLPATKSQPKEMLPVVGKPVVQYVVEELAAAGIERILFVTGKGKASIEDHFDPDAELTRTLREAGKEDLLAGLEFERLGVELLYTRQARPLGLGDAVLCAEGFAGDRPFALALGDSIIGRDRRSDIVARMASLVGEHACAVALERAPAERAPNYGIAVPAAGAEPRPGEPFEIAELIEKPADPPSDLAIAARYVLPPGIFDALRACEPGAGGEIQLTDAIAGLIGGEPVIGVLLGDEERRYDVGTVESYCRTFIELALADPGFGERLRGELR